MEPPFRKMLARLKIDETDPAAIAFREEQLAWSNQLHQQYDKLADEKIRCIGDHYRAQAAEERARLHAEVAQERAHSATAYAALVHRYNRLLAKHGTLKGDARNLLRALARR